jgi:UDP-N-acetylmuramoyl-tripeptide--D-alanyl-D-alanine ligase
MIKFICKKILQYYLKFLVKVALLFRRPKIVAVAGSINKVFFKEKIKETLQGEGLTVRSNPKGFNTEIGLPLAILDLPSGYHSYKDWLPIILCSPLALWQKNFPKVLVLELGVSDPGEMKKLLAIVKPKIAVITGITQRYLEAFDGVDELVGEYECLVKKVSKGGLVILNYDNQRVRDLAKIAQVRVRFFSLSREFPAGIKEDSMWLGKKVGMGNTCQQVEVRHGNQASSHQICRFGEHHIQALLAGLIVKEEISRK